MSTEVRVAKLPYCDLARLAPFAHGDGVPAAYDGKTTEGPWAYMCEAHFRMFGVGLGTGKGQRLILAEEEKKDVGQINITMLRSYSTGPKIWDAATLVPAVFELAEAGLIEPVPDSPAYRITSAGQAELEKEADDNV